MGHPMRLELTLAVLLAKFANTYIIYVFMYNVFLTNVTIQ